MNQIVPIQALIGGALLGLSALILLLSVGKIAGISGIVNGVITPQKQGIKWRVVFLVFLVVGGLLSSVLWNVEKTDYSASSLPLLVLAGLLVGFGTKLGNGCTSGHGICGIGRLSKRSIVATLIFMVSAALTVAVRYHG
ncbi:YeeE/YedE family protein [Vibrio sonorensis]|uniref:YeeE/YedE family protein n=1 Tax=Vibrio sonorensis TaxID=1004316 RepID=UPI0008DB1100|nr:YeeE/YedE thiosulfate transporter family protein [Vibrio sonorensis]